MAFKFQFPYHLLVFFSLFRFCTAIDTITPAQSIKDGETLISSDNKFELGVISPGNTSNRYIGIWYNVPDKIVVWIANRENPVVDSSGVLTIANDGNLVILDGTLKPLWSTNISIAMNNTSAKLLASGNLVLTNENSDNHNTTLWESFDHPTHILLAGMKIGVNWKTGKNWSLTSWNSQNDPSRGKFSYRMDIHGLPQLFLFEGLQPKWRSGPWNGQRLSGVQEMSLNFIFTSSYVSNEDEIYTAYFLRNESLMTVLMLDEQGILRRLTWFDKNRSWKEVWSSVQDQCENYAECGPYGTCSANSWRPCECLQGFTPKSPSDWYMRNGLDGCARKKELECGNGDGFSRVEHVKLPDTRTARLDASLSSEECEKECLRNCSCTGYSSADINGRGTGCVIWFGNLIDLKLFADGGQDMYVRVAASELDASSLRRSKSFLHKHRTIIIPIAVVSVVLLLVSCTCYWWRWRTRKVRIPVFDSAHEILSGAFELENSRRRTELQLFNLGTILSATQNFSDFKKLGEGGFGPVYKGQLSNGEEIAVKRLSRDSGQGAEEFRNEVNLICKLQHRNLVRILGYCIQGEEKMLVYEYMQNKSLDFYIFDQSRKRLLDWGKRLDIIAGIARGVLYLHQDSRLRIIHRDLKASNILLDNEMNPKISDFGMARIFGGNETQAKTKRVVGTYGYMSPEYIANGLFSTKSDVFSFGVIILEIISGMRNSYYVDDSLNLIAHAWKLWREGRSLQLVDPSVSSLCPGNEVLRCIHVGLLCVQEVPRERPAMSTAVYMLDNETNMPPPKEPSFSLRNGFKDPDSSTSGTGTCSRNDLTITVVEAR